MKAYAKFLSWPLLAASCLMADTIHLKNGRTIVADRVREAGTRYEYEIGENTYAIPKSCVDHVDAGGVPTIASPSDAKKLDSLPAFVPADSLAGEGDLPSRLIQNGKVNTDALAELEAKGNPELSATANFIAGKYELERGDVSRSQIYFDAALHHQPSNSTILIYYAALLVRTGRASQALEFSQRAVQSAPQSPDAYAMLGYAQFASGRAKEAAISWNRSLALRPDAAVQQLLDKAERDQTAEEGFAERESGHFKLRFEGKQTSESLRSQILSVLESDYDDLVGELGTPPHDDIQVILYTEQAFFDVTRAPSWSGAINDGKLRIPVNGLTAVTSDLARVLKHELAHSFINQLSQGRCPPWLHEGIAQLVEPRSISDDGPQLAQLFKEQREIPLNVLEGSFMRLNGMEARVAYSESLAAVTFIRDTYGMSDVQRILQLLGQGSSTEAALRATVHSDYGSFESELGKYLQDKYGR
jgi:tetratricopeptide (TPR) repeat protein